MNPREVPGVVWLEALGWVAFIVLMLWVGR